MTPVGQEKKKAWQVEGGGGVGGGAYSFVACLDHSTLDHASLPRRRTVPTPTRDISDLWALSTVLPYTYISSKLFANLPGISFLFDRVWGPFIS